MKKQNTPKPISYAKALEKCKECTFLVKDEGEWWCMDVNCRIIQITHCIYWKDEYPRAADEGPQDLELMRGAVNSSEENKNLKKLAKKYLKKVEPSIDEYPR